MAGLSGIEKQVGRHGNDGAGADVNGNLIEIQGARKLSRAGEMSVGGPFDPFARWQSERANGEMRIGIGWRNNRRRNHARSKCVAAVVVVSAILFGIVVIERMKGGNARVVGVVTRTVESSGWVERPGLTG